MNDKQKDTYIAWLNDAHAMELGLVTILEKQIAETDDMPHIQSKLKEHLLATKRHAEMVENCVTHNGGHVSATKDVVGKVTASMQGMTLAMNADALVKNIHSSYAAEHFEIATYTLLRTAAETFGDQLTSTACDQILADETDMAQWLIGELPRAVEQHLESLIETPTKVAM